MRNRGSSHLLIILLLATAVILFHLTFKDYPHPSDVAPMTEISHLAKKWFGKTAPDFTLKDLHGNNFTLSDSVGKKVIILNFFTTWCQPCRSEMPTFNAYFEKHKKSGLLLLFINVDEKETTVRKMVRNEEINAPVLLDSGGNVARLYDVKVFPTTCLIGVDGRVKLYQTGRISNTDIAFTPLLRSNLARLSGGDVVTKEAFLENQPSMKPPPVRYPKIRNRSREMAKKIVCPICGKTVLMCNDKFGRAIRKRLVLMHLEGKSEEEILRTLFEKQEKKGD